MAPVFSTLKVGSVLLASAAAVAPPAVIPAPVQPAVLPSQAVVSQAAGTNVGAVGVIGAITPSEAQFAPRLRGQAIFQSVSDGKNSETAMMEAMRGAQSYQQQFSQPSHEQAASGTESTKSLGALLLAGAAGAVAGGLWSHKRSRTSEKRAGTTEMTEMLTLDSALTIQQKFATAAFAGKSMEQGRKTARFARGGDGDVSVAALTSEARFDPIGHPVGPNKEVKHGRRVFLAALKVNKCAVAAFAGASSSQAAAAARRQRLTALKAVGLFYGTQTGNTEAAAGIIAAATGLEEAEVSEYGAEDLAGYDGLIVGTPTWNTGADEYRSGVAWDDLIDDIKAADFSGKTVAVFGCGDSQGYGDNFCDGIEELHETFKAAGAKMVGYVDSSGYEFSESKSDAGGKFLGLPLDQDNEDDKTEERVAAWVTQIKSEGMPIAAFASEALFDPIGHPVGLNKEVEMKHGRHVLLAALRPQSAWEAQSVNTQRQRAGEVLVAAAAGFAGASLGASSMLAGRTNARVASAGRQSSVARQAVGIGINGFGRIGRQVARIAMKDPEVELKLINASYDAEYLAYQMKYDSIHGRYDGTVEVDGDSLVIDGQKIALSHTRDPAEIPFAEHGADYVCESTGVFLTTEKVQPHLKAGAKKVVFSAPAKDDSHTVVMGVNQETYDSSMTAVSCASCTTNGLAPMVKAVHDAFGIKRGLMTTVHAMTASQPTVDGASKKDWRGGRAASGNIIPSSTGAAKAVAKVIPDMKGKLTGMAFRVPTIDVSVVDLTCELEKETTYEEVCAEIKKRSEGDMKGFLGYTDEALVSTDFETCTISSTFDAKAGIMLDSTFIKCVAWYDNEWGYSCRVVDLIKYMAKVDAA